MDKGFLRIGKWFFKPQDLEEKSLGSRSVHVSHVLAEARDETPHSHGAHMPPSSTCSLLCVGDAAPLTVNKELGTFY